MRRRRLASACTRSARGRLVSSTKLTARPGMVGDLPERRAVIGRRLRDAPLFRMALRRMATRPRGAASPSLAPRRRPALALRHPARTPTRRAPTRQVASAPRPRTPTRTRNQHRWLRPRLRRRPSGRARHPRAGAPVARRAAVARVPAAAPPPPRRSRPLHRRHLRRAQGGQCAFVPSSARAIQPRRHREGAQDPRRRRRRRHRARRPLLRSPRRRSHHPGTTNHPSTAAIAPSIPRALSTFPQHPVESAAPRCTEQPRRRPEPLASPSRSPPPIVRPLRLPRRARSKPARPSRR